MEKFQNEQEFLDALSKISSVKEVNSLLDEYRNVFYTCVAECRRQIYEINSMPKSMHQVLVFSRVMNTSIATMPCIPSLDVIELRLKLIKSELQELEDALYKGDLVGVADGWADLQYVLDGTAIACGLQEISGALSDEVHSSNMSKLDENGKPIINDGIMNPNEPIGKILKPLGYFKPNLEKIINEASI